MSDPERDGDWVPPDVAATFISQGWAPTMISSPDTGLVSGVEAIGRLSGDGPLGGDCA